MLYNPDVTVRMRGVMEKCTYCVQRIEHAKIDAEVSGQPIAEQRLKTACQQACPTHAIIFGDLNSEKLGGPPEVASLKASLLNYGMLDDLNTRPRTSYLARVTNPNPQLAPATAPAGKRIQHGDPGPGSAQPRRGREASDEIVLVPDETPGTITAKITGITSARTPHWWYAAFGISLMVLGLFLTAVSWLFWKGVGVWGINIPNGWGFAIINFVWWIGIGHAGTLTLAILVVLRQDWRTSINRMSEAMTLGAVACAGMFPILHLGRPWLAYRCCCRCPTPWAYGRSYAAR